jgi:hypothetical protein
MVNDTTRGLWMLQMIGINYMKFVGGCGSFFKFANDDMCKTIIAARW